MNRIRIPPKKIKNNTYENQKVFEINPIIKEITRVWIIKTIPIAKGCFIIIKEILTIKEIKENNKYIISENSLFKILILEINDKEFLFFWSFKKIYFIFELQNQCFY